MIYGYLINLIISLISFFFFFFFSFHIYPSLPFISFYLQVYTLFMGINTSNIFHKNNEKKQVDIHYRIVLNIKTQRGPSVTVKSTYSPFSLSLSLNSQDRPFAPQIRFNRRSLLLAAPRESLVSPFQSLSLLI